MITGTGKTEPCLAAKRGFLPSPTVAVRISRESIYPHIPAKDSIEYSSGI